MTLKFHELNTDTYSVEYLGKVADGEIIDGHDNLGFLKRMDLEDEATLREKFDGPYVFTTDGDTELTARITTKDVAGGQNTGWQPYEGPQGGQGWQHPQTGEIRYQETPPDAEGGDADGDGRWTEPPSDPADYHLGQRVQFESHNASGAAIINDIIETGNGPMLELLTDEGEPFNFRTDGNNRMGLEITGVADTDGPGGTDGHAGDPEDTESETAEDTEADAEPDAEAEAEGPDYSQRDDDHWALDQHDSVLNGKELPDIEDLGVDQTSPEAFVENVNNYMERNPELGAFLSEHDPEELADHTILTAVDGQAGISISPEGDIQNLFSDPDAPSGTGERLVQEAVARGGKTLDCYDTILPTLYSEYGFRETGRMEFNPEYAPENWNYDEHGQPDVVFMAYRPEAPDEQAEEYYEGYEWDEAKQDSRRTADNQQSSGEKGRGIRREARRPDSPTGAAGGRTVDKDALVDSIIAAVQKTEGSED